MNKVDIKILTTRKQYLKWSLKPTFKREKQFRNGAIVIKKEKCRINLNKLIYIGASILDVSKVLIQDFRNYCIKNKYGYKSEMLLTDNASLMYKFEAEIVYEDHYKDKDLFDFSNYPNNSKYYNNANNLVVGKMKNEACGVLIKGFIELIKILCLLTMIQNIYLKMDIVGCHIFINLLVHHIKNNFAE